MRLLISVCAQSTQAKSPWLQRNRCSWETPYASIFQCVALPFHILTETAPSSSHRRRIEPEKQWLLCDSQVITKSFTFFHPHEGTLVLDPLGGKSPNQQYILMTPSHTLGNFTIMILMQYSPVAMHTNRAGYYAPGPVHHNAFSHTLLCPNHLYRFLISGRNACIGFHLFFQH